MINWSHKRRWVALGLLIAGVVVMLFAPPVIPVIQLPGEKYPGGRSIFNLPITNSLMGSVLCWAILALLTFVVVRNMPKNGGEVPRGGFYNLFEMAFEGLYNFISGVASGPYFGVIFKMFMTIFLIVLFSNWQSIIPGVDSIGFLEPHVKTETVTDAAGKATTVTTPEEGYDVYQGFLGLWALNGKCKWVSPEAAAALTADDITARKNNGCTSGVGAAVAANGSETKPAETTATTTTEAKPAEGAATEEHEYAAGDSSVPWVALPFVRPPSTDLNLTLALALSAVVMVQVVGFQSQGLGYLTKFFNFKTLFNSPLGGIDLAVGLLELIGEFAKILSFSFRLLGNVFAGSVLLFVMSFLLPFLPWPFFILEFFVGVIQALVFGLLTAIFMNLATIGHGGHDEEHHDEAHAH